MQLRPARVLAVVVFLTGWNAVAQEPEKPPSPPQFEKPAAPKEVPEGEATATSSSENAAQPNRPANLLGQADTARGEGRRNENIQISLVDTNAARDANQRIGATATIVEEFRIERNYFSSEFGNASKGPIHAQPLGGGNGFHGNVFWNHNNSIFSARSFFQAGPVQPSRRNQYGAALSTGLWKGAFFTFNGSQDKNRGMVNGNVLIPLPSEREPLATDPTVRAIVEDLMSAYPNVAPNRPDFADRALNTNSPQSTNTDLANGQLNQKLGARDALVLRYSFTGQQVKAFQFVRGQNPDTTNKSHSSRITWNRAWDAATVTDFSVGFDRQTTLLAPAEGAVGPVFLSGLQMLGPTTNIPLDRAQNQWLTSFSVQKQMNRHAFTAGIGLTRRQYNSVETEGNRRIYQFRNDFGRDVITNLRLGTPSFIQQAFGDVYRAFRNWDLQAFAGDRWAVDNRLTLNYGIRWEPTTRPIDVTGLSKLPYNSDWNNVGGDFGFAYRLPKGYGVLRGAAGVFFGQIFPVTYGQIRQNPPNYIRIQVNAPDLRDPLGGLDPNHIDPNTRTIRIDLSPALATPYSYQYNFSWEAELAPGWRLQVGYVGSRSHKLFVDYILNRARPIPGIPLTIDTINQRRPDPTTFERFLINNAANAYYDAGRVSLIVPNWRHFTISTSYWYSKAIDTGADYTYTGGGPEKFGQGGQTENNVLNDLKALSNFDQPHALLVQASYDTGRRSGWLGKLYGGWNLSTVVLLKSGTPFGIDSGSDGPGFGNVDGELGDRVNVLDPSVLGRTIGNPSTSQELLPSSAFAFINAAAGETAGNIGKNTFRKGKIANVNAALARTWPLRNDLQMTFRAESINFFNTPQFAQPGTSLAAPNFGQITNTLNDGRTFRFLLRFNF
jgi:hypothetical protein